MSTGIVSVAALESGWRVISDVALVLALVAWCGLAIAFASRFARCRRDWIQAAMTPASLTGVAGTGVVGAAFAQRGWLPAAWTTLALASALWLVLLPIVLRWLSSTGTGAVFLPCVGTQSLSVLVAILAGARRSTWLTALAMAGFVLGLLLYGYGLRYFQRRELVTGVGEQWILAGAVAISTLAGAHILLANTVHGASRTALHSTVDALLVLTGLGYLGLGFTELRWRRWRYQLQRWATVFPLGMTAAAAASASRAERLHWLHGVGTGLAGVAIAAWLVVAGGAAADLVRSEPAATSA